MLSLKQFSGYVSTQDTVDSPGTIRVYLFMWNVQHPLSKFDAERKIIPGKLCLKYCGGNKVIIKHVDKSRKKL